MYVSCCVRTLGKLGLYVTNMFRFWDFSFASISLLRKEIKNKRDRASAREKQTHEEENCPGDDKTARIQKVRTRWKKIRNVE
jgi:hypothetical protein